MGQYYKVVVGTVQGWNKTVYCPLNFDDGLKLMEHCYVDTYLMNKIHSVLYKNPMRVLWVGDYANSKTDEFYARGNRNQEEQPKSLPKLSEVWGRKKSIYKAGDTKEPDIKIDYEHSFLVDHTTKSYIDLSKYYNLSKTNMWGIIDPLPILTVVGNGRGGGDYSGTNMNRVGSWKWHLISIEDATPDGYTKLRTSNYSFVEEQ